MFQARVGGFVHGDLVDGGPVEHELARGCVAVGIPRVDDAEAVGGVLEVSEGAAAFDGALQLTGGVGFGERKDEALHVAVFVEVERRGKLEGAVGARAEFAGVGEFDLVVVR